MKDHSKKQLLIAAGSVLAVMTLALWFSTSALAQTTPIPPPPPPGFCPDNFCDPAIETCANCPQDCTVGCPVSSSAPPPPPPGPGDPAGGSPGSFYCAPLTTSGICCNFPETNAQSRCNSACQASSLKTNCSASTINCPATGSTCPAGGTAGCGQPGACTPGTPCLGVEGCTCSTECTCAASGTLCAEGTAAVYQCQDRIFTPQLFGSCFVRQTLAQAEAACNTSCFGSVTGTRTCVKCPANSCLNGFDCTGTAQPIIPGSIIQGGKIAPGTVPSRIFPLVPGVGSFNLDFSILKPGRFSDFVALLSCIFSYLVIFAIPIAVIVLGIAGVTFLSSRGEPDKITTAKKILVWAVIGLAVVLTAKGILAVILRFLSDAGTLTLPSCPIL